RIVTMTSTLKSFEGTANGMRLAAAFVGQPCPNFGLSCPIVENLPITTHGRWRNTASADALQESVKGVEFGAHKLRRSCRESPHPHRLNRRRRADDNHRLLTPSHDPGALPGATVTVLFLHEFSCGPSQHGNC